LVAQAHSLVVHRLEQHEAAATWEAPEGGETFEGLERVEWVERFEVLHGKEELGAAMWRGIGVRGMEPQGRAGMGGWRGGG